MLVCGLGWVGWCVFVFVFGGSSVGVYVMEVCVIEVEIVKLFVMFYVFVDGNKYLVLFVLGGVEGGCEWVCGVVWKLVKEGFVILV